MGHSNPVVAASDVASCCQGHDLVEAPLNAGVSEPSGIQVRQLSGNLCLGCGETSDVSGTSYVLTAEELSTWRLRWKSRRNARFAIGAATAVSVEDSKASFPASFWLPTMVLRKPIVDRNFIALSRSRSTTG